MSGIKKIFGKGEGQDDEVMYGDGGKGIDPVLNKDGEPFSGQSYTTTTEYATGRGSISAQGGDTTDTLREDDQTYGTTSTTREEEQKYREPEKASETTEDSKSKGGLLSKIMPSKSNKEETETERATEDDTTRSTEEETHYGRDAAVAGGVGAAGAGAAAYAYNRDDDKTEDTEQGEEKKKGGLLSKILPSKSEDKSKGSDARDPEQHTGTSGGMTDPVRSKSGEPFGESGTQPSADDTRYGRDAAIAGGVGAVGAGAGAAAYSSGQREDRGDDVSKATYTERSYPLGTTSQTAGPTTTTTTTTTTSTTGSTQPPTTTTERSYKQPETSTDDTHYGRDAAIGAGTAGVLGAGTYAATRDRGPDEGTPVQADRTIQDPSELDRDPVEMDGTNRTAPHVPGEFPVEEGETQQGESAGEYIKTTEEPAYDSRTDLAPEKAGLHQTQGSYGRPPASNTAATTQEEHHYGRDAAIAGAGAAAVGGGAYYASNRDGGQESTAYEASKSRDTDPRVKPDSSLQKSQEPTTSGPYKSDIANKLDPRVKDSTPQRTEEETSTSDRNTALAGATAAAAGAGGAGYAGYSSTKSDDQYTPDSPDNRVSTDSSGHHHLHKKHEERSGEKKPGFISKLLHRDKNKENDEPAGEGSHFAESEGRDTTGTSGTTAATGATGAAGASSAMGTSGQPTMSGATDPRTGLPVDDRGMVVLVNEGADTDAHHTTITGDHSKVFNE